MSDLVLEEVANVLIQAAEHKGLLQWTIEQLKYLIIERDRLEKSYIDEANRVQELEAKLKEAQKLYYGAKKKITSAIKERNRLVSMLEEAKDILNDHNLNMHDHTRERLNFLNHPPGALGTEKLETIMELNSTDDLMSELSYTKDEDDMLGTEENTPKKSRMLKRASCMLTTNEALNVSQPKICKDNNVIDYAADKNQQVIATTTVTVPHKGPLTASSVIEAVPSPLSPLQMSQNNSNYFPSAPLIALDTASKTVSSEEVKFQKVFSCQNNTKLHNWTQKSHIMGEICTVCYKRIKFSSVAFKCSNCRGVVHTNCKEMVPLPCFLTPNTKKTGRKHKTGCIEDFVPLTSPMVPYIIVQCIREIESRGLNEVGLYRVPGSDKEVKSLKEKLLKAKGVRDLSDIPDINTLCCCLKEFLRSLKDTLIPQVKWKELAHASEVLKGEEKKNKFLNIIQSLPQANRDTLSYLVLHLQKVAAAPNCKMPVVNLSKMFGPIIVGYSNCESEYMLIEANISNKIMSEFLRLPSDSYEELLYGCNNENRSPELVKTPTYSSLFGFFSDSTSSVKTFRKERKFFNSP